MPYAPTSRCRCGEPATHRGRCDKHQPKPWEVRSAHARKINAARWRKVKAEHLQAEPQCRTCGSTDDLNVDHILNIARGGALYDHENLQTLCTTHHQQKSEQERLAGLRAARSQPR